MLGTRPDIAYAVTKLSRFSANPKKEHLDKALYICRYLVGTPNYSLVYKGKGTGLIGYTDSDWASDPIDRRSITGYFFMLAGGIISWRSRAQKSTATSSTQAEYMAMSDCAQQAIWIKSLLSEIEMLVSAVPICGDNQGSIFNASNPAQESHMKHIDIHYHFVCKAIENGQIELFFVPGNENPADMFTKNLGRVLYEAFWSKLGLEFY